MGGRSGARRYGSPRKAPRASPMLRRDALVSRLPPDVWGTILAHATPDGADARAYLSDALRHGLGALPARRAGAADRRAYARDALASASDALQARVIRFAAPALELDLPAAARSAAFVAACTRHCRQAARQRPGARAWADDEVLQFGLRYRHGAALRTMHVHANVTRGECYELRARGQVEAARVWNVSRFLDAARDAAAADLRRHAEAGALAAATAAWERARSLDLIARRLADDGAGAALRGGFGAQRVTLANLEGAAR